jgi:hypothetical protein
VDAMAPFASAGIVNMPELAAYILQFGFNIKNPEKFVSAQPPAPAGPAGPAGPAEMPPMVPPPAGMA